MTAPRHSCLRVSRLVTLLSPFSRRAVSGSFSNLLIGKCQKRRLITHDYTDPACPDVVRRARLAQPPKISTGAFKDVRSRPDRPGPEPPTAGLTSPVRTPSEPPGTWPSAGSAWFRSRGSLPDVLCCGNGGLERRRRQTGGHPQRRQTGGQGAEAGPGPSLSSNLLL